jgi:hypothetical protein
MIFGPRKRKYFAACEYWVYLPGAEIPDQELLMTRMISRNPYARGGELPITKREGLIFSDIRLHISLVLRSKNPHVFRPDLLGEPLEISADALKALADSQSLVKVRYVSEEKLTDDRHLQFLPHYADSVIFLAKGLAVYDVVAERLYLPAEFAAILSQSVKVTSFDAHVRVLWHKELASGNARTKGLIKKGFPELQTDEAHLDQQVLVTEVMEQAARQIWDMDEVPKEISVNVFDDEFKLEIQPAKTGPYRVRILRIYQP